MSNTENILKKGKSQFYFVGKPIINDYTFKLNNTYDSGWVDNVLNLGIDTGNQNIVYCDLRGGYHTKKDSLLYVNGFTLEDGKRQKDDYQNRFTIEWDDRFDESVLESVADSCFITVGVEKDASNKVFYKKFLSAYDAIQYLSETLTPDHNVIVKGKLNYKPYKNEIQVEKTITSIYLTTLTEKDFKATFTQSILVDSDSVKEINKDRGTIDVSAKVVNYISKLRVDEQDVVIKQNVALDKVFELKINENPELTSKLIKKFFKPKKGKVNEIVMVGDIIEGGNITTVDYEDIPEDIQYLVELGLYTEEEAKAKCVGKESVKGRFVMTKPDIVRIQGEKGAVATVSFFDNKYSDDDIVTLIDVLPSDEYDDEEDDLNLILEDTDTDVDSDEEDELRRMLDEM